MCYNGQAFSARIRQAGPALAVRREALDRVRRLRERSRKDPELMSLCDDPVFQALVGQDTIPT